MNVQKEREKDKPNVSVERTKEMTFVLSYEWQAFAHLE